MPKVGISKRKEGYPMDILIVLVVFSALILAWERITSPTQDEKEAQRRLQESERRDATPEEW